MIGYVTLGTKDLAKAAEFYDAIAAELDTPRMMEFDGSRMAEQRRGETILTAVEPVLRGAVQRVDVPLRSKPSVVGVPRRVWSKGTGCVQPPPTPAGSRPSACSRPIR